MKCFETEKRGRGVTIRADHFCRKFQNIRSVNKNYQMLGKNLEARKTKQISLKNSKAKKKKIVQMFFKPMYSLM